MTTSTSKIDYVGIPLQVKRGSLYHKIFQRLKRGGIAVLLNPEPHLDNAFLVSVDVRKHVMIQNFLDRVQEAVEMLPDNTIETLLTTWWNPSSARVLPPSERRHGSRPRQFNHEGVPYNWYANMTTGYFFEQLVQQLSRAGDVKLRTNTPAQDGGRTRDGETAVYVSDQDWSLFTRFINHLLNAISSLPPEAFEQFFRNDEGGTEPR